MRELRYQTEDVAELILIKEGTTLSNRGPELIIIYEGTVLSNRGPS